MQSLFFLSPSSATRRCRQMLGRACTPLTAVKKEREKRACSQSKSNVLGPTNTKLNEHVLLTHVTRYGGHEVLGFYYFLLAQNVPSGEERGETDVFTGYLPHKSPLWNSKKIIGVVHEFAMLPGCVITPPYSHFSSWITSCWWFGTKSWRLRRK